MTCLGYSSGSAGGTVTPVNEEPRNAVEPPPATPKPDDVAEPPNPSQLQPSEPVDADSEPAQVKQLQNRLADFEADMLATLQAKIQSLEETLLNEVHEKKRRAEELLEQELFHKRQKIDAEIFDMEEQRSLHETRLAIASEQLQERMLLVTDEQKVLDDLREKGRALQKQLDAESVSKGEPSPKTPLTVHGMTEGEKKELLKLKLAKISQGTPESTTGQSGSATPSPPPTEKVPEAPSQALMVPTSDQRFTSSTHPQAWHCLYRMTKKQDGCDAEIYKMWHEGGEIFRG